MCGGLPTVIILVVKLFNVLALFVVSTSTFNGNTLMRAGLNSSLLRLNHSPIIPITKQGFSLVQLDATTTPPGAQLRVNSIQVELSLSLVPPLQIRFDRIKHTMADLTDATQTLSLGSGPEDLSPLEQEVLEEYERLADNMKKVCRPRQSCKYYP